jgi:hypothetical protein
MFEGKLIKEQVEDTVQTHHAMENNIGKTDKWIRVLIGTLIIIVGAHCKSVWGVLGMIPIITSQIGVCLVYSLFHINTVSEIKKKKNF